MHLKDLQNKKIAILGLGVEGIAMANYLLKHGIPFSILDEKPEKELQEVGETWRVLLEKLHKQHLSTCLGKQLTSEIIQQFDIIIRSPGISLRKPYLKGFTGELTSQTKLFFAYCPAKIIGVTGTKGKGTTATLIYEMLKKSGKDAYLGGNIGKPPISFLDTITPQSIVVLELSSFQLEDVTQSPHIAVMLMVTQEHLEGYGNQNYHETVEDYREAKRNIMRFQTAEDIAVLNVDYPATVRTKDIVQGKLFWVSRYQDVATGCFVRDNAIILRDEGFEEIVLSVTELQLPGKHNFENVSAATLAAYKAGVSLDDIRFVLRSFKGLEHRLELVREKDGVKYYDDSFSTVPETTIAAIQAFSAPEILILGGSSKHSDFTDLGKVIGETKNIKAIIGIGVEWQKIKEKITHTEVNFAVIEGLTTMQEIVAKASKIAKPGDVVLLSPACASFGMFQNYKDRGNQFKEQVNLL